MFPYFLLSSIKKKKKFRPFSKHWRGKKRHNAMMIIISIQKKCMNEIIRFCWWELVESAVLLSLVSV